MEVARHSPVFMPGDLDPSFQGALVVTIGRGAVPDQAPLPLAEWRRFQGATVALVSEYAPMIAVRNLGMGPWNEGLEENFVVVGLADRYDELALSTSESAISRLASDFGQESIAVITGTSRLVRPMAADPALPERRLVTGSS